MKKLLNVLVLIVLAGVPGYLGLEHYFERDAERQLQLFAKWLEDNSIIMGYDSLDYSLLDGHTVIRKPWLSEPGSSDRIEIHEIILRQLVIAPDDDILIRLQADVLDIVIPAFSEELLSPSSALPGLTADLYLDFGSDPAARTSTINRLELHASGLGRLGMDADMGNVHPRLMAISGVSEPTDTQAILLAQDIYWHSWGLYYQDEGLVPELMDALVARSSSSREQNIAGMRDTLNGYRSDNPILAAALDEDEVELLSAGAFKRFSLEFKARDQGAQISEFLILAAVAGQGGEEESLWQWLDQRYQFDLSVQ